MKFLKVCFPGGLGTHYPRVHHSFSPAEALGMRGGRRADHGRTPGVSPTESVPDKSWLIPFDYLRCV